jgi:hypothetical protein
MQTWARAGASYYAFLPSINVSLSADKHRVSITLLPKSRLARHGINRLPLFWAKLDFPRRHVFLQVRER